MRLLKTQPLADEHDPQLVRRLGDNVPPYAILSHTWSEDPDNEVSFADVRDGRAKEKSAFSKLRKACDQAKRDGHDYLWMDTCCIDNTNSVELSEAINTMYRYYVNAKVCYAYLADVHWPERGAVHEHFPGPIVPELTMPPPPTIAKTTPCNIILTMLQISWRLEPDKRFPTRCSQRILPRRGGGGAAGLYKNYPLRHACNFSPATEMLWGAERSYADRYPRLPGSTLGA